MTRRKSIFITGGASGIGQATALKFAKEGANVVLHTAPASGEAQAETSAATPPAAPQASVPAAAS